MMEETKKSRFKRWCREHEDGIVIGAIWGTVIGVIVGLTVLEHKQDKAEDAAEEMRNQQLMEAISRRDLIIPMRDGSFMIIPEKA